MRRIGLPARRYLADLGELTARIVGVQAKQSSDVGIDCGQRSGAAWRAVVRPGPPVRGENFQAQAACLAEIGTQLAVRLGRAEVVVEGLSSACSTEREAEQAERRDRDEQGRQRGHGQKEARADARVAGRHRTCIDGTFALLEPAASRSALERRNGRRAAPGRNRPARRRGFVDSARQCRADRLGRGRELRRQVRQQYEPGGLARGCPFDQLDACRQVVLGDAETAQKISSSASGASWTPAGKGAWPVRAGPRPPARGPPRDRLRGDSTHAGTGPGDDAADREPV